MARDDAEALRSALAEFFFASTPPEPEAESERARLRIAWSWLDQHRDGANAFDVEMAGTLDETLRVVAAYLAEGPDADRVFHV